VSWNWLTVPLVVTALAASPSNGQSAEQPIAVQEMRADSLRQKLMFSFQSGLELKWSGIVDSVLVAYNEKDSVLTAAIYPTVDSLGYKEDSVRVYYKMMTNKAVGGGIGAAVFNIKLQAEIENRPLGDWVLLGEAALALIGGLLLVGTQLLSKKEEKSFTGPAIAAVTVLAISGSTVVYFSTQTEELKAEKQQIGILFNRITYNVIIPKPRDFLREQDMLEKERPAPETTMGNKEGIRGKTEWSMQDNRRMALRLILPNQVAMKQYSKQNRTRQFA
jgi:hypothetical protein